MSSLFWSNTIKDFSQDFVFFLSIVFEELDRLKF